MSHDLSRILLTGSKGQVGSALRLVLPQSALISSDRNTLNLANPDSIRNTIRECRPTLIINAAAYTAVDRAETEADLAMTVNGVAPGVLAEEAKRINATLVHYSTDYVFDGTKLAAYNETDTPNPLSIYGKTKLAGEQAIQAVGAAHYILRTSWVYASEGKNLMNSILRLAQERPELRVVNDQTGAPTWARAIAEMTTKILTLETGNNKHKHYGLYHMTATGAVTWFGFAEAVLEAARNTKGFSTPKLIPIKTADYPLPARRPVNSRLDTSLLTKIFGITPASWQEMFERYNQENQQAINRR
jgi:dTDP-4-dehydrorhamnose reductase